MMVMNEIASSRLYPIYAQTEPEKERPSGCPFDAMFATCHLMKSQVATMVPMDTSVPRILIPEATATISRTTNPAIQGTSVIALPVKLRFGRPGTRTQDTIHFKYQTMVQGIRMMVAAPSA